MRTDSEEGPHTTIKPYLKRYCCEAGLWYRNGTLFSLEKRNSWNEHPGWCNHFNRGLRRMLAQTVCLK